MTISTLSPWGLCEDFNRIQFPRFATCSRERRQGRLSSVPGLTTATLFRLIRVLPKVTRPSVTLSSPLATVPTPSQIVTLSCGARLGCWLLIPHNTLFPLRLSRRLLLGLQVVLLSPLRLSGLSGFTGVESKRVTPLRLWVVLTPPGSPDGPRRPIWPRGPRRGWRPWTLLTCDGRCSGGGPPPTTCFSVGAHVLLKGLCTPPGLTISPYGPTLTSTSTPPDVTVSLLFPKFMEPFGWPRESVRFLRSLCLPEQTTIVVVFQEIYSETLHFDHNLVIWYFQIQKTPFLWSSQRRRNYETMTRQKEVLYGKPIDFTIETLFRV